MARILVFGSSNTDMMVRLPKLPSRGQTVLGGSLLQGPGGKGANQAVAAARAGAEVIFVTAVGDDLFGRRSLDGYASEGIDIRHAFSLPGADSGIALIFVDDGGENMIGVAPGANASLSLEHINQLPSALFEPGTLMLIAGLEIPLPAVVRAIERGKSAGMTVVLNPAPVHPELINSGLLKTIDVLTPNRIELSQLTGCFDGHLSDHLRSLADTMSCGLVVTLGAEGCLVSERGEIVVVSPHRVDAVDSVGAGDAFSGALATALSEGRSLNEAARWANAAAALAVTKPGAQAALPFRSAIDQLASRSNI